MFLSTSTQTLDAAGCAERKRVGFMMGTWVRGESRHPDLELAERALTGAFEEMKRLERLLNRFDPQSTLSRVNREAAYAPVTVEPEVFEILTHALKLAQATDGCVDLTSAPLTDLWKEAERAGAEPREAWIKDCLGRVGHDALKLDPAQAQVRFLKEGMGLDLGAIGKGYILDRAAEVMKSFGVEGGLLDAGGNIRVWGREESQIGIRDPLREGGVAHVVSVRDGAVATTGAYERYFRFGKKRYGHILDLRIGRPASPEFLSASVVARDALGADALSTPAFLEGERIDTRLAALFGAHQIIMIRKSKSIRMALTSILRIARFPYCFQAP